MSLFATILTLNLTVALFTSFIIFSYKKFARARYAVGCLAILLSAWSGAELARGFIFAPPSPLFSHISLASFFGIGALYLTSVYFLFASPYIRRGPYYFLLTLLGIYAVAAAIPGVLIKIQPGSNTISLTPIFHLGVAIWFFVVGGSLNLLRRAYTAAASISAARISIFTIASAALIVGFFAYSTSWYGVHILLTVYICVSLFIALATYAAFAEHVADIHTLVSQFVIYGLSMIGVLAISGTLLLIVQSNVPRGVTFETLAIMAISLFFLPFLVRMTSRMQGSITDMQPSKLHAALRGQIRELITILDLQSLAEECVELLKKITTSRSLALLIRSGETHNLEATHGEGFDFSGAPFEPANNIIMGTVQNTSRACTVGSHGELVIAAEHTAIPVAPEVARAISEANIATLLPVMGKRGLVGCIVLGKKTVGSHYTPEEIELLEFFSSELAVALENARVYSETKSLSSYLQNMNMDLVHKIESATVELRGKNQALEHANQKLKELSELKTDFLNMASHQFRTPTAVIRGMLSMIEKHEVDEATRDSFIQKMRVAADRLSTLIADFLNAAKIEGGGLMLKFESVDICRFIEDIVDELLPLATKKQLALTMTPHPREKVMAEFDTQRMHEALYNFVDNSIKYTPSGSVHLLFSTSSSTWTLEVADTGIGIPSQEIGKLFQKFYRTEAASQETPSGTGLGLYVAKKIIEEHGGSVAVQSSGLGKGSTFTITAPLYPTAMVR